MLVRSARAYTFRVELSLNRECWEEVCVCSIIFCVGILIWEYVVEFEYFCLEDLKKI